MNDIITKSMIQLFRIHYTKIVNINLSEGTYSVIWLNNDVACDDVILPFNMFKNQVLIAQSVHPDDVGTLTKYCDEEFIRRIIEDNKVIKTKFRLKDPSGTYKWTELEIVPGLDYSSENCSLILYYRDIDADYARDYERHRQMEEMISKDCLTRLNTRYSFDKFIKKSEDAISIGLVYLDLNQLKEINDTEGHLAGDQYIKYFCGLLTQVFRANDCYRIGGDEFVVAIKDISQDMFEDKVKLFAELNSMSNLIYPISSMGTYWSAKRPFNILNMVQSAEKEMYEDKHKNHRLIRKASKG